VLPFRNQSQEPTLSGARVSLAYCNELLSIRGFEVLPLGVVENQMAVFEAKVLQHPMVSQQDFQQFAKYLGVDAVLQGAVTDYSPYYPPRIAMKVNWYAANPGFHPIPVGYGLPWGTKKEKSIPEWIRLESERSLATEQLKSQTPVEPDPAAPSGASIGVGPQSTQPSVPESDPSEPRKMPADFPQSATAIQDSAVSDTESEAIGTGVQNSMESMPNNWPDPQGFIPRRPTAQPPEMRVQHEPIISYMRTYNGSDEDFTQALEEYFYFRDDARFGGWKAYLQRSEDFIRFSCHQHIVETLASRGGQLESRMIFRWPINRYER
jgi:hypothetical protein